MSLITSFNVSVRQFLPLLFAALMFGCSGYDAQPVTNGQDYMPLEKGAFIIYQVRDIRHLFPQDTSDTTYYKLKEVVSDTFTDAAGLKNFRLLRYKQNKQGVWNIDSVWSARNSGSASIRTENNLPFIKLTFPLREGSTWNGYRLFDSTLAGTNQFTIKGLGKPLKLSDSINFPATLQVVELFDTNCRGKNINIETYARNIGIIYKEEINLDYKETPVLCERPFSIEIGRERRFTYISHGKEK